MAVSAVVLIYMLAITMMQGVSGAPVISRNNTNPIKDGGVEINATQKSSLLEDGLFEGDIAVT